MVGGGGGRFFIVFSYMRIVYIYRKEKKCVYTRTTLIISSCSCLCAIPSGGSPPSLTLVSKVSTVSYFQKRYYDGRRGGEEEFKESCRNMVRCEESRFDYKDRNSSRICQLFSEFLFDRRRTSFLCFG